MVSIGDGCNDTDMQTLPIRTEWFVIYGIEGLLTLLGNLLTIAVFWKRKRFLKRATYLLINLAVADSLVGLLAILSSTVHLTNETSSRSPLVGKTVSQISLTSVGASILSLTCIALERAFAFVKPLRHRTTKTRYYYYVVFLVWLLTGVFCTVSVLGIHAISVSRIGVWISFSVYGSSLMIISICYAIIWWTLSKRPAPEVLQRRQNRKIAVTLSALTLLSLVTFVPGEVYVLFRVLSDDEDLYAFHAALGFFLVYGNSLINPFVYVLRMRTFRREVLLLFNCKTRYQQFPKNVNTPQNPEGVHLVKFRRITFFT